MKDAREALAGQTLRPASAPSSALNRHGDDLGALACEQLGAGLADARGAAGDQNDFDPWRLMRGWLLSLEARAFILDRRHLPAAAELDRFVDQANDIVLRPVSEHVAGLGRIDAEILAHRVDQIRASSAPVAGRHTRPPRRN